jgi:hypothetical protein
MSETRYSGFAALRRVVLLTLVALALVACGTEQASHEEGSPQAMSDMEQRLAKYTSVRLSTDLSGLDDNHRQMIPLLIDAAKEMDALFWEQAYGDKDALLASIEDEGARRFAEWNYGPWDRLADNEPFLAGYSAKPEGANLYPVDMTREEFESAVSAAPDGGEALKSLYTLVRRDDAGNLTAVPYSRRFSERLGRAAGKLRDAAALAEDPGLKRYIELRADALLSDDYQPSDLAWMDMKDNRIDIVVGPIEVYEDQLYNYKAAFEAYVLVKDLEWSERLARYAAFLPTLQQGLPVPDAYKQEELTGTGSDLNAYDVIYYAGDCNAGSKTIAINLPNDEEVQIQKGTRRLQLKNAMRAKFDEILVPIAGVLIDPEQRKHVTFEAFFGNTMFHEVAHGLGIKNTINDRGTVREALREQGSALEEGKADVLGLYMVTSLLAQGEVPDMTLQDSYVTFMASIFRSIRFGVASSHGKANLVRFNFFKQMGAFTRDDASGTYRVDIAKVREASEALSEKILRLQGDGDYEGAKAFWEEMGVVGETLQADLDRLGEQGIPVDIVFEQGLEVLGL